MSKQTAPTQPSGLAEGGGAVLRGEDAQEDCEDSDDGHHPPNGGDVGGTPPIQQI